MIPSIGLCTHTAYEDGFLGVQADGDGDRTGLPSGEAHYPTGLYARPLDPGVDAAGEVDPTRATLAFYHRDGVDLHVVPFQDTRIVPLLPTLDKGGSVHYGGAPGSLGYAKFSGTGSWTLHVPPSGTARVEVGLGAVEVTNGTASVILGPAKVTLTAADAGIEIGPAKVALTPGGITISAGGPSIGVGGPGAGVTMGSGPTVPLAKAGELVSYITALEALLVTLAAALDAKTPSSSGVSAGTVSAFIGATAALKTALATTEVKGA